MTRLRPDYDPIMRIALRRHLTENWKFFLLVIALCLGAYLNILDNAFVSDDYQGVLLNPDVGNLALSLRKADLNVVIKDIVFLLFGKSVLAYHSLSILLHTLATILAYFFVLLVTNKKKVAVLSTLLFALHPVHTEAITWISGRGYALYSVFFLTSFLFYHFYLEKKKRTDAILAIFFFALAVFSSSWALPLMIIYPLYGWYLKKRSPNWKFYAILIGVAAINLLLVYKVGGVTSRALRGARVGGTRDYTITMPHSVFQYSYVLLAPLRLAFYRENDLLTTNYIWFSRALAFTLLFLTPLILFIRKRKTALFFLAFFFTALSLSLSPIKVGWYVAERYLYLPSLSFTVFTAYVLLFLEEKLKRKNRALLLAAPLLIFYFGRTVIRNNDWQNRKTLWQKTIKDSPRSPRAYNNLGTVYGDAGNWQAAAAEFQQALKLKPNYAHAARNLGIAYINLGDLEKAEKYLKLALKLNPQRYTIAHNLGVIQLKKGNLEEAKKYFNLVLRINPYYEPSLQALKAIGKPAPN